MHRDSLLSDFWSSSWTLWSWQSSHFHVLKYYIHRMNYNQVGKPLFNSSTELSEADKFTYSNLWRVVHWLEITLLFRWPRITSTHPLQSTLYALQMYSKDTQKIRHKHFLVFKSRRARRWILNLGFQVPCSTVLRMKYCIQAFTLVTT